MACRRNLCIVLAEHYATSEMFRQQTQGQPHPIAVIRPVGESLRLDVTERASLGDRMGIFLSYRRDPPFEP